MIQTSTRSFSSVQDRSLIEHEGRAAYWLTLFLIGVLALLPAFVLLKAALWPVGFFDPLPALAELSRPVVRIATWNTLESATLSAVLALGIGGFSALLIGVSDMRGKRLFAFLMAMGMLIAPQVAALAFKTMAGPASPLLKLIGMAPLPGTPNPLLGRVGIILVLGLHHAPLVMLTLLAGLKTLPNSLIEAAEMDGASAGVLTRRVVLPCLSVHIAAAAMLSFVAGLGNFGIPALLGLPVNYVTLPTLIYRQLSSFGPGIIADVATLSIVLAVLTGIAVMVSLRILAKTPPMLDGDKGLRPYWRLGRWRWLVEAMAAALVAMTLILPFLSLLASALVPAYGMPLTAQTVTLRAFGEVMIRQASTVEAFRNSFLFAGAAAVVLAFLALPVSYGLVRIAGRSRALLQFLVELPFALPGIVIAIAAILLFLKPLPLLGVSLYATPWIILFAYLARFLSMAIKPVAATLSQLEISVEEAASLCGAGLFNRLRHVLLPALLPSMLAGAMFVFLSAFNELTVSALLWSAGTRTLGVILFSLEEAGLNAEASALAILTMLIVAVLMLALDRLGKRLPPGVVPWSTS
ncbi:MAG: ABC transporter permease [Beijerinckiaceae bacterium]